MENLSGKQSESMNFQLENEQSSKELNDFVQNLLKQMEQRFDDMSSTITGKVDEMGKKIEQIEHSLTELMEDIKLDEAESQEEQR